VTSALSASGTPAVSLAGTGGPQTTAQREQLKAVAQQFEAIFLRQMIGSMRQAKLSEDDLFDSSATDQFTEMSDARLADSMASTSGLGIADMLLRQFDRKAGA